MTDGGSMTVQQDAQMGMFRVLKPFADFEQVYQGVAGTIPVAFPGTLEPAAAAAAPGYDRNLLAGFRVPLGSRVLIMIPMTIDMYTPLANYEYQIIWRVRNQSDVVAAIAAQQTVSAYHLPSEAPGRHEFSNIGTGLVFLPGASDIEVFEEDAPGSGAAALNIRQQRYVPQITAPWVQPLTPAGNEAVWQQGAYQFSSNENCGGPTWSPLWTDAAGDELCILAYKTGDAPASWDFAGADLAFSNTYGTNNGALSANPNVGILISTGTMGG